MREKRLELETDEPLSPSLAVTVRYNDALFLGEIMVCAETRDAWRVEVAVEQVLSGLQSLLMLRSHLLGETTPAARPAPSMNAALKAS